MVESFSDLLFLRISRPFSYERLESITKRDPHGVGFDFVRLDREDLYPKTPDLKMRVHRTSMKFDAENRIILRNCDSRHLDNKE